MTAYPRLASTLVLSLVLAACGSDPVAPDAATLPATDAAMPPAVDAPDPLVSDAFSEPPDAFTPPTPDAGPATVSFAADVMPILASCMGSGCHTSPRTFFFGTGRTGCPSVSEQRFVVPFDPDASYVIHKIEGTEICGMRMPRGRAPLSAGDITTIRTWIAEGARDN
jgi:hypothetical protein